jgi:hypothetical protein
MGEWVAWLGSAGGHRAEWQQGSSVGVPRVAASGVPILLSGPGKPPLPVASGRI